MVPHADCELGKEICRTGILMSGLFQSHAWNFVVDFGFCRQRFQYNGFCGASQLEKEYSFY